MSSKCQLSSHEIRLSKPQCDVFVSVPTVQLFHRQRLMLQSVPSSVRRRQRQYSVQARSFINTRQAIALPTSLQYHHHHRIPHHGPQSLPTQLPSVTRAPTPSPSHPNPKTIIPLHPIHAPLHEIFLPRPTSSIPNPLQFLLHTLVFAGDIVEVGSAGQAINEPAHEDLFSVAVCGGEGGEDAEVVAGCAGCEDLLGGLFGCFGDACWWTAGKSVWFGVGAEEVIVPGRGLGL